MTIADVDIECSGCAACAFVCPKHCVLMAEDKEGFLRPQINLSLCVQCGTCFRVCPAKHPQGKRNPLAGYAGVNKDKEVRRASSTAGVFTAIAKSIVQQGGIVCGAAFDDDWMVRHVCVEDGAFSHLLGSKYVQSVAHEVFSKIVSYLRNKKKVLFVGTPCQVAGLTAIIPKDVRGHLLAVELCCHGVPSPLVWRRYLKELFPMGGIATVSFRNKSNGWRNYSLQIKTKCGSSLIEGKEQNSYMRGFLGSLFCRPSCSVCKFRQFATGSDMAIGDFWGLNRFYPEKDDNSGCNQILILSKQGELFFGTFVRPQMDVFPISIGEAIFGNLNYLIATPFHKNRNKFWALIRDGVSVEVAVRLCMNQCWITRIKRKLVQILRF